MTGMMLLLVLGSILVVLDVAAMRWGADSRDWSSETHGSPFPARRAV